MYKILLCMLLLVCSASVVFAEEKTEEYTKFCYEIECDNTDLKQMIITELDKLFNENQYLIVPIENADYQIRIAITYEYQEFYGTLPSILIPVITATFHNSNGVIVSDFTQEFRSSKLTIASAYLFTSVSEFELLQKRVYSDAINQLNDIVFPRKNSAEKPNKTDPIEEDNTDNIIEDTNVPEVVEIDETNVQTKDQDRVWDEYELSMSTGYALSSFVTDNGLDEGLAEPGLLKANVQFSANELLPVVALKLSLNIMLVNTAEEAWTSRTNELGGTILDISIIGKINIIDILALSNDEKLSFGNVDMFAYAGLGVQSHIINLNRTNVNIGEYSYPDEKSEASIIGLILPVNIVLQNFMNENYYLSAQMIALVQFGYEITSGIDTSLSFGYCITMSSSISVAFSYCYIEYAIAEDAIIDQNNQGVSIKYSINF